MAHQLGGFQAGQATADNGDATSGSILYHREITVPIHEHLQSSPDAYTSVFEFNLRKVYQDKDFYTRAIQMTGQNNFEGFLYAECLTNWQCMLKAAFHFRNIDSQNIPEEAPQEVDCVIEYFCRAHCYATVQWMKDGMKMDPHVLASILGSAGTKGIFNALKEILNQDIF